MKIRVKFAKYGNMKFIGHLDVMRYFQKANRRAGIPVKYSEGFNPHQIMSFAAPLGLGDTSECEYMDMEVLESGTSREMVERLNREMVDGFTVISWRVLPEKALNAMAAMTAADYELTFREGFEPENMALFEKEFDAFLQRDEILVTKKTKKAETVVNIRPLLYEYRLEGGVFFCRVAAGSMNNLKPELLLEAFSELKGQPLPTCAIQVHRKELYTTMADGEKNVFLPLEDVGKEITGES